MMYYMLDRTTHNTLKKEKNSTVLRVVCMNRIGLTFYIKKNLTLPRATIATVRHKSYISMGRSFNNILKYNVF